MAEAAWRKSLPIRGRAIYNDGSMATAAPPPVRPRRAARLALAVLIVLVLLAIAAGGAGLWFYRAARGALPQLDGTLKAPGLTAPVSVIRDRHGVPHLTAGSPHDLFFVQGFVTAQDRLWQMDMTRRFAAGELAEVLGPDYVAQDRRQRILGMRAAAEAALAALPPEVREHLAAYAAGVNAYIASRRDRLPIEFRVLRYTPRAWAPADSMLVGLNMTEMLNLGYARDILEREKVAAQLGPQLTADLYPVSSWRDHPPNQVEEPLEAPQPTSTRLRSNAVPRADLLFPPGASDFEALEGGLSPGSNNWVLSGAHTASGKPLLSNDMHHEHHIPNVWYEAHLVCAACPVNSASGTGFDVAGVTLPGLPYVISGHNRRIAWGFTNLGPAVLDFFEESFNAQGEYLTPEGWRAPQRRREVIHVRGKSDVKLEVVVTRHGPIVTSLEPGETRKLALEWVLYDPAASRVPFYDIDSAGNWEEFTRALARFGAPAQNVVYADVDGHIGYHAAGLIPIRKAGDGLTPQPGGDGAHDWTGYVPFEQLPNVLDPPSGILATANGRVTPDNFPYLVANEWGEPYRTQRIYRVLESDRKFTPADMLELQTDVYSEFDRFFAERLVYAVDQNQQASARARQAADLLRKWNGGVSADSAVPSLLAAARTELTRRLLEPRLGRGSEDPRSPAGWQRYRWFMSNVWLENILLRRPDRWLPPGTSSWDDLLTLVVERVISRPAVPTNLETWRWGEVAPLYLEHPLFGLVPVLRRYAGPGLKPQSGNGNTVKQVGRGFGPSERLTVDFSDLDNSTLNIVTGQSGQIFSPYYMDQWPYWYQGRSFSLPFSAAAVEKASAHRLELRPN